MQAPAGRVNDLIRLPSGALIPCSRVWFALLNQDDIRHLRVIQDDRDRFRLLLVTAVTFSPERLADIRAAALESLGEPVTLDVQIVDAMPADAGKDRWFVSNLPPEAPGGGGPAGV
jgi:hypothetical protein